MPRFLNLTEIRAKRLAHTLLLYENDMRLSEIITIYLAIGAPFGVYVYVQAEKPRNIIEVWLKTFGAMFIYPLFLFNSVRGFFLVADSRQTFASESDLEAQKLETLQRDLTGKVFGNNTKELNLFDFREILERYIGLSLAWRDSVPGTTIAAQELEIFRLSGRTDDDLKLAAGILQRRNFLRLQSHQIQARRDFLTIFANYREKSAIRIALEIAKVLNDAEASLFLQKILDAQKNYAQNNSQANVKEIGSVRENDVLDKDREIWKPPTTSPVTINQTLFKQPKRAQALTTQTLD